MRYVNYVTLNLILARLLVVSIGFSVTSSSHSSGIQACKHDEQAI